VEARSKKALSNLELYQVLNNQVLKTVQRSGLDYFHCTEHEQHGNDFTSRFSAAIQSVFDQGYDNVICVGNDSPQLSTTHISTALQSLENGSAALGPSLDGGFYLMGIKKSHFNREDFASLPWQTNELAGQYYELLASYQNQFITLDHLIDLDSYQDVIQFLSGKNAGTLLIKNILLSLKLEKPASLDLLSHAVYHFQSDRFYNKGSPRLAA
jgi:glycosyltransferase A (GT-A) superfamily protein (DUF2064 family)